MQRGADLQAGLERTYLAILRYMQYPRGTLTLWLKLTDPRPLRGCCYHAGAPRPIMKVSRACQSRLLSLATVNLFGLDVHQTSVQRQPYSPLLKLTVRGRVP